jgi:hypothetical protein
VKRFWKLFAVLFCVAVVGCAHGYRIPVSRGSHEVRIVADASRPPAVLDHAWEYMTGSGNASLYIRPVWKDKMLAHLADVHQNLGIQTVRFHAIFLDAVGVYQGPGNYNFENVDKIYDAVLAAASSRSSS